MSAPIITRPVQGAAPNQFITIEADQAELQRVVDEIYATANPEDRERAEDAADRSQAWAESPTPPDPDDATSKSSKTWAGIATTQASEATTQAGIAVAAAIAAGASIVTELTDPVPADGTLELLLEDAGLRLYEVQTGAWEPIDWVGRIDFPTVATLLASPVTSLGPEGQVVYAGGFRYEVVTAGEHVTTAGGVKLRVLAGDDGSVNVKAFGALGDNINDDTAAIQGALDAALNVCVPPGDYVITSTLTLRSSQRFWGKSGRDGTTIRANGITAIRSPSAQSQVVLEGFRIRGDDTSGTWGVEAINNQRGIKIRDVYCSAFGSGNNGGGFSLDNGCWNSILDCIAAEFGGRGVFVSGSGSVLIAPRIRNNSGIALETPASGNTIAVIGGTIEKTWPNSGAVRGDQPACIVLRGSRNSLYNVYCEQAVDGLVAIFGNNCSVQHCFLDGLSGPSGDKADFGLVYVAPGAKNNRIIGNYINGLDSAAGTGLGVIYIDEGALNTEVSGNWLEPDGATGSGNSTLVDLGTNTTRSNNQIGNSELYDGFFTRGFGFSSEGEALFSGVEVSKPDAGIGPKLVLKNDGATSATGTGSEVEFLGNISGRKFAIRSQSTGTFSRSPVLIFASRNDSETEEERMRVLSSGGISINNGPRWLSGDGTPEGSVSAPVGSFYSREDGGAGTTFYVKESGTGNTGWVAK